MRKEVETITQRWTEEVKRKEKMLIDVEEEHKLKTAEVLSLTRKLENCNMELADFKSLKDRMEKQIDQLKLENKTLKNNNEGYLNIIEQQNKTINRINNSIKEKENDIDQKENERQSIYSELMSLKRTSSEKDIVMNERQTELNILKKKLEQKEEETLRLHTQLDQEREKIRILQEEKAETRNQFQREKEEKDLLEHQTKLLENKLGALDSGAKEAILENDQLKKENDEYRQKLQTYTQEIDRLNKQLIEFITKNSDNEREVKQKLQELDDRSFTIQSKEKEIQRLNECLSGKDVEISKLTQEYQDIQTKTNSLNTQIQSLTIDLNDSMEECERLRQYLVQEKSFIIESDPTLKLVLMMKQEGFTIDDNFIDRVRGKSIFNLLRAGIGIGKDKSDIERRNEETIFAEKALSNWLTQLLPNDYKPEQSLYENISDGVMLCKMIDTIFKEVQPCDHIKCDPSLLRNRRNDSDNISVYLDYCKKLELKSSFEPNMIFKVLEAQRHHDMNSVFKERSLIVSNIAQVFELSVKCAMTPRTKQEVLTTLFVAKQEREQSSPLQSRSRSTSVTLTKVDRRPKRNSFAFTNLSVPSLRSGTESVSPKSALLSREMTPPSLFGSNNSSPVHGSSQARLSIPNLSTFTISPRDSSGSARSSSTGTEDDIWLEHMIEDMKLSMLNEQQKFSLKYYLNMSGSYFISEEQRDEFMNLLPKCKFTQFDFSGCLQYFNFFSVDKEICEMLVRLCENKHALRADFSGFNLKPHSKALEQFIAATSVKYLVLKDCGLDEQEKVALKQFAKKFDVYVDV
ncbi:hypothetical protein C9374_007419 [Naegleria lovaniensis]|uniref:Calponin-homology (CH) domain-containing protein n=1 Tax=Naegleria lovaniensis TaxID=51637 RepID=A0AA88GM34_NAELO|nr:uncharacterized protein C9374_007419 [Naegleria lovaniensis]KAG2379280.1 hypothetical protein C9374_007419 [Naegleria lovaniensis]